MTANQIWAVAEDDEGNMWFGSYGDGLYQFDGRKFKHYTQKDGLADNNIRVLHYSKHFHCLMAGSETGISTFRNGKITTSPDSIGTRDKMYCVTSIFDAGEFVYITTFGPVNPIKYYPDKNLYICMNGRKSNYPNGCTFGYLTSTGDTLFAENYNELEIHKKGAVIKVLSVNQVFGIAEDKRGNLWLASWSMAGRDFSGGIFRYDGQSAVNFKSNFGISDKEIWAVLYDREADVLWIGTLNEGLFMVPGWLIAEYLPDYFNLDQNLINNLYIDSQDRLLIAGNRELLFLNNNGTYGKMDKHTVLMTLRNFWTDKRQHPVVPDPIKKFNFCKSGNKLLQKIETEKDFNYSAVGEGFDHTLYFSNEFGLFSYNEKSKNIKYLGPESYYGNLVVFDDTLINCGGLNTNIRTDLEKIPDGEYNTLNYPLNK
jgi:ligand-binding sensor domain-containing protein